MSRCLAFAVAFSCAVSLAAEDRKFQFGTESFTIVELSDAAFTSRAASNRLDAIKRLSSVAFREDLTENERGELVAVANKLLAQKYDDLHTEHAVLDFSGSTKDASLLPAIAARVNGKASEAAIAAIVRINNPSICPTLLKVAQDPKARNRGDVIRAIGRIGDADAFKAMEKVFDKEKDPGMRESYALALDAIEKRLKVKQ